jgi:hypothetical protein
MENNFNFHYSLTAIILVVLIAHLYFFSKARSVEDFDLVYSANPFVSKGYHQLLGITVPNDCPSCPSCPSIIYSNATELGNSDIPPWNIRDSDFSSTDIKWIWNSSNAQNDAPANVYIWFYFAFYDVEQRPYYLYAVTDDKGTFYFNDNPAKEINHGWGGYNSSRRGNIGMSKNGFNYIKVCAYNGGGPAGLLIHLRDYKSGTYISTNGSWLVTTTSTYNKDQPVPTAKFVVLGVGTDGQLYVRKSTSVSDPWRRVPKDDRNDLIFISVGSDGRSILGVTRQYRIITKPSWSASTWTTISNNCCVTSMGIDKAGRIYGLGTDRKVWTKDSLQGSWVQRASKGENISFLSVDKNRYEIYMIDSNQNIWKKSIAYHISSLGGTNWQLVGFYPNVKAIVVNQDNTTFMIDIMNNFHEFGTDGFGKPSVGSNPSSCCVVSICKPISFGDPDV